MQSNQRCISYRAHKLFGRPSWKMAAYGLVPKKYMGWIAQVMSVKNKQNSSVKFLVRAEFLTYRTPARPPASGDHYTPQP